jgi:hypothetical protein
MIFSRKNAGKWVASKNNKVVETSRSLNALVKKVASRKDKDDIVFDRVPNQPYFAGSCGVSVYGMRRRRLAAFRLLFLYQMGRFPDPKGDVI